MKVFVSLLCVALFAVASGSPAGWLSNVANLVNENINKATNAASEKGQEGLAKVKELIAQLQKQGEKIKAELQSAGSVVEKTGLEISLNVIKKEIEKLQKVEEKLSSWMGKN